MIQDDELRDLFRTECEEHLQVLDDGLLRLEISSDDKKVLEEVFRAAHSLKGTARMLGVNGVETIAHHIEDELGHVRRGHNTLDSSAVDRFSSALSALRQLVKQAVGEPFAAVTLTQVLGELSGRLPLKPPARTQEPLPADHLETAVVAELELPAPTDEPLSPQASAPHDPTPAAHFAMVPDTGTANPVIPSPAIIETPPDTSAEGSLHQQLAPLEEDSDFKIQTMRVAPARLDALMTLASELTVTTTRASRGLTAYREVDSLWEEWSRDIALLRRLDPASSQGNNVTSKALAAFGNREQIRMSRFRILWEQLRQTTYQDVDRLNFVADELEEGIRKVRLLPLSQIFNLYPRLVRDLARSQGKEVRLVLEGADTTADKHILEELKDPLMHMLRNAVDHGVEEAGKRQSAGKPRAATIVLKAWHGANHVMVELRDDGCGLDLSAIRNMALKRRLHTEEELNAMTKEQLQMLIFAPGFSTSPMVTDVSGRGVGMDVVRINVEKLKGSIRVHSEPGFGTTFTIRLPSTLATTRVLLVRVAHRTFALPAEWVHTMIRVQPDQVFHLEGRPTLMLEGRATPLVALASLLELKGAGKSASETYVVLAVGEDRLGVQVDALLDEQEVVLKPLGALLKRVRNVLGVTILGAGDICSVLNVQDLARSALRLGPDTLSGPGSALPLLAQEPLERKCILLAEDSITTRTQEKRILEAAGYEVVTAVDGAEALGKLGTRPFDALVADVEMPNMDGLTLTARARAMPQFSELPIILVTSLASDEDKRRGNEAGASAYITKGDFEQKVLLDTLRRLL